MASRVDTIRLWMIVLTVATCGMGIIPWIAWEIVNSVINNIQPSINNGRPSTFTNQPSIVPFPPTDPVDMNGPSNEDADDVFELAWRRGAET